jgi:hypothetical protein
MAKYYGMQLYLPRRGGVNVLLTMQSVASLAKHAIYPNKRIRFYIHPDSLSILEPRDDDWGQVNTLVDYERCDTVEIYVVAKHDLNVCGDFKIIQRNNTAFFWPEVEP